VGIPTRSSVIGGCNSPHSHRSSVTTTSAVQSLRNHTDGTASRMLPAQPPQCATLCSRTGHVPSSICKTTYHLSPIDTIYPLQYTLFANASLYGTPPVRALFFEFPQEPELLVVDRQFMLGSDILVTPVLTPNVTSVSGEPLSSPPPSLLNECVPTPNLIYFSCFHAHARNRYSSRSRTGHLA
jgi:hypothetical protein